MNLENEVLKTGEKYFTLVVYDIEQKQWINEFGDYDKKYVVEEMDEYIHGYLNIKRKNIKILKTLDDQKSIDAAINKLNGAAK